MGLSTSSDEIEDVPVPPQEAASLDDIAAAYPYAHNPPPERRCTCQRVMLMGREIARPRDPACPEHGTSAGPPQEVSPDLAHSTVGAGGAHPPSALPRGGELTITSEDGEAASLDPAPERRCTCILGHDLATATTSRKKCPEHGR